MTENHKKIVAITGSIGSGKSTLATLLSGLGIPSIDADKLARAALDPQSDCLEAVIKLLGPEIRTPTGAINRKLIAKKVFSDDALKKQLEAIMHPTIQKLFQQEQKKLPTNIKIISYQIPLLFEKNIDLKNFYKVVSVCAPREICIQRVMARSRYSYQLASKIFNKQFPQKAKISKSDLYISNHGSVKRLERIAQEVVTALKSECGEES